MKEKPMTLPDGLITNRTARLPGDWKKQPVAKKSKAKVPAGSGLEEGFLRLWRSLCPSLPEPKRNFRFHKTRKWEIDFAWPAAKLAVEIEGLTRSGGRHQQNRGYTADAEKYRELVKAGWRLLRWTSDDLRQRPIQCVEETVRMLTEKIEDDRNAG